MGNLFYWVLLLLSGEFIRTVVGLLIINWFLKKYIKKFFFETTIVLSRNWVEHVRLCNQNLVMTDSCHETCLYYKEKYGSRCAEKSMKKYYFGSFYFLLFVESKAIKLLILRHESSIFPSVLYVVISTRSFRWILSVMHMIIQTRYDFYE